jgi:hypothetical protein
LNSDFDIEIQLQFRDLFLAVREKRIEKQSIIRQERKNSGVGWIKGQKVARTPIERLWGFPTFTSFAVVLPSSGWVLLLKKKDSAEWLLSYYRCSPSLRSR